MSSNEMSSSENSYSHKIQTQDPKAVMEHKEKMRMMQLQDDKNSDLPLKQKTVPRTRLHVYMVMTPLVLPI